MSHDPEPYYPHGHQADLSAMRQARATMTQDLAGLVDLHDLASLDATVERIGRGVGDVLPAQAWQLGCAVHDFLAWQRSLDLERG